VLKKATLFTMIGISYIFLLRLIGTFYPQVFRKNILLVQVTGILLFLALLAIVFFFIFFLREYLTKEQIKLKNATRLALAGSIAMLLPHLKGLLAAFNVSILSFLSKFHSIDPMVPWINSILVLIFFIVFYKDILNKEQKNLKKPIFLAVVGAALTILVRSFTLFKYFYSQEVRWFADLSKKPAIILIPIVVISFATIFYFFFIFYKHPGESELREND